MTPERYQRVAEIFQAAVDRSPEVRPAFLAEACADDDDLRREVDSMLAADAQSRGFLDKLADDIADAAVGAREVRALLGGGLSNTAAPSLLRLPPGKNLGGRFRIVSFIAAGGMGDVYEAEDLELRERVAVKTILSEYVSNISILSRFKREIQYAKKVSHPNVCRIHDLGVHREGTSEIVFLTMELLHGETLAERLRSKGRMTMKDALPFISGMAEALSAIHQSGIIHRDFKTSNVILVQSDAQEKAVVTDFGLARSTSADSTSLTEAGRLVGTPAYMAPEQLMRGELTPATDVYALGLVMYEMLTGSRPFGGNTPSDAVIKRLTDPPLSPAAHVPDLSPRWEATILRCLERDPSRRFQNPRDVTSALTSTLPATTVTLTQWQTRFFRNLRRFRPWVAPLAVLLMIVLVLAAALVISDRLRNRTEPPQRSIAVLPFDNIGGDPQSEYYSDGFTEELINSLTRIPELRVIARESSLDMKRTKLKSEEIGKRLRVRALVRGSILRSSGKLRVVANLVNAADGFQIWSHSYELEEKSVLVIEDQIADAIAVTMNVKPAGTQIANTGGPLPTLDAQELYWMGRYHWRSRTEDGLRRAIEYFQRAIEKDPSYAAAFSGLADAYSVLAEWNTMLPAEALVRAKTAAAKAVSLNGNLAEAQVSLAHVTSLYDRDYDAAEKHFLRAFRLSPNLVSAHQWYSYMLLKQRRFDESMQHARRALDLDPVSVSANQNLAALFHYLKQDDDMIRQYRKVLELEPHHTFAHLMIAEVLAQKGLASEAYRELEANASSVRDDPLVLRTLGEIGVILDNRGQAETALRQLIAKKASGGVSSCYIAGIYAMLGNKDEAFLWLERAYGEWDGFLSLLQVYPAFDSLRSDARYTSLLVRLGLKKRTAPG